MDLDLSPDERAFRDEVRAFLDTHLPPDLREAGRRTTSVFTEKKWSIPWQKILHQKGWVAPSWPKEYGGTGWSDMQRYIWSAECARAGGAAPRGPIYLRAPVFFFCLLSFGPPFAPRGAAPGLAPMGLRMVGPC